MRKKITIVTPSLGLGGGEKVIVDIVRNIDYKFFDVYLLVIFAKKNTYFEELVSETEANIVYLNKKPGISISVYFKVLRYFNMIEPDVVHTNQNVMQYILPAILVNKIKVKLHTVHSIANKEVGKNIMFIMRFAYKFCGVIPIAVGEYVKKTIASNYKLRKDYIQCIYNGIDLSTFNIINKTQDERITRLITTGTLYSVKNHELMIKAFNIVTRTHSNIELIILGDGILKSYIYNLVEDLGLGEKVILMGAVNDVAK